MPRGHPLSEKSPDPADRAPSPCEAVPRLAVCPDNSIDPRPRSHQRPGPVSYQGDGTIMWYSAEHPRAVPLLGVTGTLLLGNKGARLCILC